jgi:hypothetical protein
VLPIDTAAITKVVSTASTPKNQITPVTLPAAARGDS